MKKLFFAAFALVAGVLSAQAQTAINPRIEVGANFARGIYKPLGVTVDTKVRTGFRASVAAEIELASGVYLAPGVTFRQEGYKYTNGHNFGLNYISVPVDLGIRVGLGDNLAVSVEAGPSFAYGISTTGNLDHFKTGAYKRFDMGLNASAALEYSKVYLRLGTDIGLVNALKTDVAKSSYKNASFFAGVGYRF
jgi:hypothetical protein